MPPSLSGLPVPPPPRVVPPSPVGTQSYVDENANDHDDLEHLLPLPPSLPAPPQEQHTSSLNVAGAAPASRSPRANRSNPFNFEPMIASKSPMPSPKPNQRRGHKYKHSSVSHQIFLEPPPRAPLSLPASLPMPTWSELYQSVSREQRIRAIWCICHLFVAAFTLWSAQGSLALTALSHLIVFDALGASLCVAVDVLGNFEVWKRSSIRYPFGLERAEVLAGFAMSVLLLFMGFDIISHASEHFIELVHGMDEHGHSGVRVHEDHVAKVTPGSINVAALAAVTSTVVSAVMLGNHARIGRAIRFTPLAVLPSILSNPSHALTLVVSLILLLVPLISVSYSTSLDIIIAISTALAMITIGVRLVKVLGSMLLMSYGPGVQKVIDEIAKDPNVREIQEARFWQVHHGLCIATLRLVVGDCEVNRVKEMVGRLVRERMGGGPGGKMWEVSVVVTTTS